MLFPNVFKKEILLTCPFTYFSLKSEDDSDSTLSNSDMCMLIHRKDGLPIQFIWGQGELGRTEYASMLPRPPVGPDLSDITTGTLRLNLIPEAVERVEVIAFKFNRELIAPDQKNLSLSIHVGEHQKETIALGKSETDYISIGFFTRHKGNFKFSKPDKKQDSSMFLSDYISSLGGLHSENPNQTETEVDDQSVVDNYVAFLSNFFSHRDHPEPSGLTPNIEANVSRELAGSLVFSLKYIDLDKDIDIFCLSKDSSGNALQVAFYGSKFLFNEAGERYVEVDEDVAPYDELVETCKIHFGHVPENVERFEILLSAYDSPDSSPEPFGFGPNNLKIFDSKGPLDSSKLFSSISSQRHSFSCSTTLAIIERNNRGVFEMQYGPSILFTTPDENIADYLVESGIQVHRSGASASAGANFSASLSSTEEEHAENEDNGMESKSIPEEPEARKVTGRRISL